MTQPFDYASAFSRNLGWVTAHEQAILRTKRVAVAGLGGVGGSHLLTLTRLGIGAFHLADFDVFELVNFNRQMGASLNQIGRSKVDVLAEMARDINPELDIRRFPEGVHADNVSDFLAGTDLYLDGLDFFAVQARREVFRACAEMGVPAVTAAPLGMGVALLNFLPGGMTADEYFRWDGQPEEEQLLRFLLGLSPAMLQAAYLIDATRVDLARHRGPSTAMACELCAGVAATYALKILLRRGKVPAVPRGVHFDAYRNRLVRTWRPWGNRNPIQQLSLAIGRRRFGKRVAPPPPAEPPRTMMEQILDLARWAPSGDNAQPWRFEIVSEERVVIHAAAGENVYEYNDGQPTWLSLGFLLESLRIAASGFGRAMAWSRDGTDRERPRLSVDFPSAGNVRRDALYSHLLSRSVDRRRYRLTRLTAQQKETLERAIGEDFHIHWAETMAERWRWTRVNARATQIRLTIPEAHEAHRRILDWGNRYSAWGIPVAAIGIDGITRRLMRWAMQDWHRLSFLNRFLAGTVLPTIEMDLLPGLSCAAHFYVTPRRPGHGLPSVDTLLAAGMALQRLWLMADKLGLAMQPSLAPLAFASHARRAVRFSANPTAIRKAAVLEKQLRTAVAPRDPDDVLFLARIGMPLAQKIPSRSMRRPLSELLVS